jgi:hemolysin III
MTLGSRVVATHTEPTADARPRFSLGEERAHYLSHGLGAAFSIPAVALLLLFAVHRSPETLVGCAVYGAALVLMYAASTVYHAIPFARPRTKRAFQRVDHCAIFLLISGTYTPLALTVLRNTHGYLLLATVWAVSALGSFLVVSRRSPGRGGPLLMYLAMSGAVALTLPEVTRALGAHALFLLLAGGLAYAVGVLFYALRRIRYHHAIWHGFVLIGSALHFLAICWFVVPYVR